MSTLNISTHISKLIEALILFVVISGGVIAGLYVASKAELTPFGHGNGFTVGRLQNRTTLEVGSEFPSVAIVDALDQPVDLKSVLKHKKTIIGFVNDGCGACQTFVDAFTAEDNILNGDYQLLLISSTPEHYWDTYDFATYKISMDFLEEYEIYSLPTLIAVDQDEVIRWVSSGFSPQINRDFIKENL